MKREHGLFATLMIALGFAGNAPAMEYPFTVYNNLGYQNIPDLGVQRVNLVGEPEFPGVDMSTAQIPTEIDFKKVVRARTVHPGPLVFDFEHMSVAAPGAEGIANLAKWRQLIVWAREVLPTKPIGIYWFPGQVGTAYAYSGGEPVLTGEKAAVHARSEELAALIDVLMPSLYAPPDLGQQKWCQMARNWINDAKHFNKPVYPYLWPERQPKEGNRQYVAPMFWNVQLEAMTKLGAQGAVLWSLRGSGTTATNTYWLEVTQSFLKDELPPEGVLPNDGDICRNLPTTP